MYVIFLQMKVLLRFFNKIFKKNISYIYLFILIIFLFIEIISFFLEKNLIFNINYLLSFFLIIIFLLLNSILLLLEKIIKFPVT